MIGLEKTNRKKMKIPFFIKKSTYFDYPCLFIVIFLCAVGVLMVYSISSANALYNYGNSGHFAKRQMIFAGFGSVVMIIVSKINYKYYYKLARVAMAVSMLLVALVPFIGSEVNGSKRWIDLGFISFQPSEICKVGLVIYTAYICSRYPADLKNLKTTALLFIIPIATVGIIAASNLSTAIICAGIVVVIWAVATPKIIYLFIVGGIGSVGGFIFILTQKYRMGRIKAWLHPDLKDDGYQTMQSLYAIGSGGLFGKGLGQGYQKLGNIPEAHNDMIFAAICEELGIIGAAIIIFAFLVLIWRLKLIAEGAPDRFSALIAVGIIAHISLQAIVNISVVTNVIPNTGVPLPFISYGGTSMVFLLAEMGIALGVSRYIVPISKREDKGVVRAK